MPYRDHMIRGISKRGLRMKGHGALDARLQHRAVRRGFAVRRERSARVIRPSSVRSGTDDRNQPHVVPW